MYIIKCLLHAMLFNFLLKLTALPPKINFLVFFILTNYTVIDLSLQKPTVLIDIES